RGTARAMRRRRAECLLQRSAPLCRRPRSCSSDGSRDAQSRRRACREVAGTRARPSVRDRNRARLRHTRSSRVRGTPRLRGDRHGDNRRRWPLSPHGAATDLDQLACARGSEGDPRCRTRRRARNSRPYTSRARVQPHWIKRREIAGVNTLTELALADLSQEERDRRYDRLQERLRTVWSAMRLNKPGESLVVVPSITPNPTTPGSIVQAHEERFLFLLLLLREPRLQMIYVTSLPIAPEIIEYYLALLPGVIPSHARARLHLIATGDGSARALSAKLLERPRILERIRDLIPDPGLCHLVPYSTSELERDIALALGIPMYGADPRFFRFGTKSGCRRLFREEGVALPLGTENVRSIEDVIDAISRLRAEKPSVRQAMIKLNEGVAGMGNAIVNLDALPAAASPTEREELRARVETIALEYERKA